MKRTIFRFFGGTGEFQMKIIIESDHAGYELKKAVMAHLTETGVEFIEAGCMNGESCDYPLVAKDVCTRLISGEAEKAVLICGTGVGISIAANKIKGIRAALCGDWYSAKYTGCTTTQMSSAWAAELSAQDLLARSRTFS